MAPVDRFNAFLDYPRTDVPGVESGALAGARLAVKDIYDVAGYPTGCGNPQKLAEAAPATATANAVQTLLDAGARFIGKTQTDELAFSLMGINAHYPQPINPAAPDRITGGSSSGSAAAVAGGLAEIATGSDTGGSIRAPASFCGLIGLRTTHGRITMHGAMPLAPSFDTFGWFADDIESYEATGKVLLGRDAHKGALTRLLASESHEALVSGSAEAAEYQRMRTVIAELLGGTHAMPAFTATVDELYWCFRRLQAREAWTSHGEWILATDARLGPGVEDRFHFGRSIDPKTEQAENVRRITFRAEIVEALGENSVMVIPTVPSAAPHRDSDHDQLQAFREQALRLLCLAGLSGLPQITLPLGTVSGAPFGISLIGPANSDIALIRLGRKILERTKIGR